ncbi:MAG: hypothetical protein JWN93_2481 [Hyphomicrobiales bacterium]|nr:hypothetical protein [Hyphomicrobiales bacterium]
MGFRMAARGWTAFALLALMAGQGAWASDIEGLYSVVGSNPGQPGNYKGEAQIKQTGKTYTIVWRVGESRQVGTGLLVDNVLSVVFTPVGAPRPGIAVFSVADGKISTGVWTSLGSQIVAEEVWSASDRP